MIQLSSIQQTVHKHLKNHIVIKEMKMKLKEVHIGMDMVFVAKFEDLNGFYVF